MIKSTAKRTWTLEALKEAVKVSRSRRQVLIKLGLKPAGGNYFHLKRYIEELKLDTSHFFGMGWNVGLKFIPKPRKPLNEILVEGSYIQSFKLKQRLFEEGLKTKACELCGWNTSSQDGRIPLELDHINGNKFDNRLENLRVICPNCHSLQPTHRGLNKRKSK